MLLLVCKIFISFHGMFHSTVLFLNYFACMVILILDFVETPLCSVAEPLFRKSLFEFRVRYYSRSFYCKRNFVLFFGKGVCSAYFEGSVFFWSIFVDS
ncbi:unnamed protein product [Moneuplotes crassus]|uniref:Uncharacterized protein n=1 Tax=Euplotes crassus TaxID=5936 RepID=A0AAD2D9K1_EUPCR|nr:unnamed protein product [Moneuplotes crassus]